MCEKFINATAISEELTGSRNKISRDYEPKKYKGILAKCQNAVEKIVNKYKNK